jgi:hypothetical protein
MRVTVCGWQMSDADVDGAVACMRKAFEGLH